MNHADISRLVSKLRYPIPHRHRNLKTIKGPSYRLTKLSRIVTALFKYERIELNYNVADEARQYAERLISDAIRHGDCHEHTMEMVDFWIEEKQIVHKLFKVLAPRYKDYTTCYTMLYKAPKIYPKVVYPRSVLELRGNPFPPLIYDQSRNRNLIHNILMDEARKDYRAQKNADIAKKVALAEKEFQQSQSNVEGTKEKRKSEAQNDSEVSEGEELLKSTQYENPKENQDDGEDSCDRNENEIVAGVDLLKI